MLHGKTWICTVYQAKIQMYPEIGDSVLVLVSPSALALCPRPRHIGLWFTRKIILTFGFKFAQIFIFESHYTRSETPQDKKSQVTELAEFCSFRPFERLILAIFVELLSLVSFQNFSRSFCAVLKPLAGSETHSKLILQGLTSHRIRSHGVFGYRSWHGLISPTNQVPQFIRLDKKICKQCRGWGRSQMRLVGYINQR